MTSLQEAGGRVYDYAEVVAALTRGIAETWQVELLPGQLTAAERQLERSSACHEISLRSLDLAVLK